LTYSAKHAILLLSFPEGGWHGNENSRVVLIPL
jgi:hypothetical protein